MKTVVDWLWAASAEEFLAVLYLFIFSVVVLVDYVRRSQ